MVSESLLLQNLHALLCDNLDDSVMIEIFYCQVEVNVSQDRSYAINFLASLSDWRDNEKSFFLKNDKHF